MLCPVVIFFSAFYELAKLCSACKASLKSCCCHFLFVTYRSHVIFLVLRASDLLFPRASWFSKWCQFLPPRERGGITWTIFGYKWAAEDLKPSLGQKQVVLTFDFLLLHLYIFPHGRGTIKFWKNTRGLYFSKALFEWLNFGRSYIRRDLSTQGNLCFKIDWV